MAQQSGHNQQQGTPQKLGEVDGTKDESGTLPIQEPDDHGTQPEEEPGTDAQLEKDDEEKQREPQKTVRGQDQQGV